MKDFVYISSLGVLSLKRKISEWTDEKDFLNWDSKYFSETLDKYLSFQGFYEVLDFNKNSISLEKQEGKTLDDCFVPSYDRINLVFPEKLKDLKEFSDKGMSLVKGEIWNKLVEGKIKRNYSTYSVSLNGL